MILLIFINDKSSKTINNANCDENVGENVKISHLLHAWLPDDDFIMYNKD